MVFHTKQSIFSELPLHQPALTEAVGRLVGVPGQDDDSLPRLPSKAQHKTSVMGRGRDMLLEYGGNVSNPDLKLMSVMLAHVTVHE